MAMIESRSATFSAGVGDILDMQRRADCGEIFAEPKPNLLENLSTNDIASISVPSREVDPVNLAHADRLAEAGLSGGMVDSAAETDVRKTDEVRDQLGRM